MRRSLHPPAGIVVYTETVTRFSVTYTVQLISTTLCSLKAVFLMWLLVQKKVGRMYIPRTEEGVRNL